VDSILIDNVVGVHDWLRLNHEEFAYLKVLDS